MSTRTPRKAPIRSSRDFRRSKARPNSVRHYLGGPADAWTIPLFDFSLGIPEVLLIEIEGTATISGTFHDLGGMESVNPVPYFAVIAAPTSFDEHPFVWFTSSYVEPCTGPCDFVATTDMTSAGFLPCG